MYIKCFMLYLSSALSRRVGVLQISLISIFFSPDNYRRGICSGVVANFGLMDLRNFFLFVVVVVVAITHIRTDILLRRVSICL